MPQGWVVLAVALGYIGLLFVARMPKADCGRGDGPLQRLLPMNCNTISRR